MLGNLQSQQKQVQRPFFHCAVCVVCIEVAKTETSERRHTTREVLLGLVGSTVKSHESVFTLNSAMQMFVASAYFNFIRRQTENNGTEMVLYHIL